MKRSTFALVVAFVMVAGCGGDDTSPIQPGAAGSVTTNSNQSDAGDGSGAGGSGGSGAGDEVTPEASGPLAPNTIRIGDQVWERTLPMTTGQCFLYEDDGTLPDSGTAWGTLDGDEDLRYAASYNQDGTFEAEISNNLDMYWGSGPRFQEDDLVVELDFDTLTITGEGTFRSLTTGERAEGSFVFVCEPEDQ